MTTNSALPKLIRTDRAFCIAPAGAGKTETILDLCLHQSDAHGKQLILTHTHAGVHSIKKRLIAKGYSRTIADINTIDSFCIEWVHAYPYLSGLNQKSTSDVNWTDVRKAFLQLVANPHIKNILQLTWQGLIVDEYQDCGKDQHLVILELSHLMKARIFGDPLQGIFEFDGSILDWDQDVATNFTFVPFDPIPARWMKTAPDMGNWLINKRKEIIQTRKISLDGELPGNVHVVHSADYRENLKQCSSNRYKNIDDSHLVIHHQATQQHSAARNLGGTFRSIEELEFDDLRTFALRFDKADNQTRIELLLDFIGETATGITKEVKEIIQNLLLGKAIKRKLYIENKDTFDRITEIFRDLKIYNAVYVFLFIKKLPGVKIFRGEAWRLCLDSLKKYGEGSYPNLTDSVKARTNQYRHAGRFEDPSTVGRIRLVKGLEFDHVYLFNFHQYSDPREAYVALTRAKKTLTIFTDRKVITYTNPGLPDVLK